MLCSNWPPQFTKTITWGTDPWSVLNTEPKTNSWSGACVLTNDLANAPGRLQSWLHVKRN